MDSITWVDIIGWSFGIIGLVYAWYQNREIKRLKDISRMEAWNLYQTASVSCGIIQSVLKTYKTSHSESIHTNVLEELAKADACSLETYRSTIRHVQMVEPRFDINTIDYWVKSKKIPEHQWVDFRRIVVDKEIAEKTKQVN